MNSMGIFAVQLVGNFCRLDVQTIRVDISPDEVSENSSRWIVWECAGTSPDIIKWEVLKMNWVGISLH